MNKKNKAVYAYALVLLWLASLAIVFFVGYRASLEPLRLEMEELGLVFCEPIYPPFSEPYAIPVNISWADLESYNNGK